MVKHSKLFRKYQIGTRSYVPFSQHFLLDFLPLVFSLCMHSYVIWNESDDTVKAMMACAYLAYPDHTSLLFRNICWRTQSGACSVLTQLVKVSVNTISPRNGAHHAGLQEGTPLIYQTPLSPNIILQHRNQACYCYTKAYFYIHATHKTLQCRHSTLVTHT